MTTAELKQVRALVDCINIENCGTGSEDSKHVALTLLDTLIAQASTVQPQPRKSRKSQKPMAVVLAGRDKISFFWENGNYPLDGKWHYLYPGPRPDTLASEDTMLIDALSRPGWELGMNDDEECYPGHLWQVHICSGGRNDREWTLIGQGANPREALRAAIRSVPGVLPEGGA